MDRGKKNKGAQELARLRVQKQTKERRQEIAKKAARTRWDKQLTKFTAEELMAMGTFLAFAFGCS